MKNIFLTADATTQQIVRDLGRQADAQGLRAWVVGGYVRDVILKRSNKDLDVVVEGNAIEFARQVASVWNLEVKAHPRFGTAILSGWPDGRHVDCVSARSETYSAPGALPVVKRSQIDEDLRRRDFTINAMAAELSGGEFGSLYDPFSGGEDLKRGMIRVFHDQSFEDDPTRLLRAVRFEQRFGFRFSRRTGSLIKQGVVRRIYRNVSGPRFFGEFVRGLAEKEAGRYICRLKRLGLLAFLTIDRMPAAVLFHRLDDLCLTPGFTAEDRRLIYLSALYSESCNATIDRMADVFQWRRQQKKQVAVLVEAARAVRVLKARRASVQVYRETFGLCSNEIVTLVRAMGVPV